MARRKRKRRKKRRKPALVGAAKLSECARQLGRKRARTAKRTKKGKFKRG